MTAPRKRSREGDKKATIESMAALRFEAFPAGARAIGSRDDWMTRAANAYPSLAIGLGALDFNDVELAERMSHDPAACEAAFEVSEELRKQALAYSALSKMLEGASLRLMGAVSRVALEKEAPGAEGRV